LRGRQQVAAGSGFDSCQGSIQRKRSYRIDALALAAMRFAAKGIDEPDELTTLLSKCNAGDQPGSREPAAGLAIEHDVQVRSAVDVSP
jgi:hypothetical protein